MPIVEHDRLPWGEARPGVRWRFVAGQASTDQTQATPGLTMFFEEFEPGTGVPPHSHTCEEILTILEGEADLRLGGESRRVSPGFSAHVPPGTVHAFQNAGSGRLTVQCVLSSTAMVARWQDGPESGAQTS
ncbi:MAG: cupin domain-containing protein [Chloroflexi bacterium]|nr:cupin domain-containing protein [Chloroflexota bacterium]